MPAFVSLVLFPVDRLLIKIIGNLGGRFYLELTNQLLDPR